MRPLIDSEEVEVSFLHTAGPSRSFTFPKPADVLVIAEGHILMMVNPTTATGRAYQLSNIEAAAAVEVSRS